MNNQGSRAERRAMLAKAKKKAEFAKSLTPLQQEYIDEIKEAIRERTKIEMIASLDVAVTGALIKYTELTLEEIFDVNVTIGKYLGEIKNIERKMNSEERIMKIKAIEKEVAQIVCEMVIEGKERKDVVKAVREKFKGTGLTTAEINVAYKRACEQYKNIKEEWKEESEKAVENIKSVLGECDKETKDALEYIFAEDTKETQNKARIEEKEVGQANISKVEGKAITSEKNGDKKASKLKVIKEVTKVVERYIQGEYGLYNVKGSVVTVDEEFAFSNVEDVKGWASSEREDLLKQIAEIKSKINHINSCELEAIEVIETYM